jgi:two-component system, OmpR family, alkaline phosphatase synthesis response regulator PhoP
MNTSHKLGSLLYFASMQRVLLVYQTEGASVLARDLEELDVEVESVRQDEVDDALGDTGLDALVVEASANLDETKRLLESPTRPQRAPLLLLVRADQLPAIDATWPADDFAILPLAADELRLRLRRAIYRRTGADSANVLRSEDLVVDLANYKVFVTDQPVSLTFKEFELLRFLMTNRGKVFTREALLNRVWGYEYFGGARTVDVHIRRLRAKIETGATVFIETVRNVGYRFPADR